MSQALVMLVIVGLVGVFRNACTNGVNVDGAISVSDGPIALTPNAAPLSMITEVEV